MQRYFAVDKDLNISDKDKHHIINVMRMKINDKIEIVYDEKEINKIYNNIKDSKSLKTKIMNDIKEKVNSKLANYKHVKKIILTTEPMEKTTTSKIKRNIELMKIEED